MVYDLRTQVQRVAGLLAQSFEHIRECAPDENAIQGVNSNAFVVETSEFLSELLLDEIATFKIPAFEEEREWRLVVRPRWIDKSAKFSTSSLIKFRESRGYLVPYLELRPPEGRLSDPCDPLRTLLNSGASRRPVATISQLVRI